MRKLYFFACIIFLISCKKDDPGPVTIGFTLPSSEAVENAGVQSLVIEFDRATDQVMELAFTVSGDAALNGDYQLTTPSPLTIPTGETSTSISLNLIDELIIEPADKTLVFTLTTATGGMLNSAGNLVHTFTLKDNDVTPANSLQFDLTWDLGAGVNIDLVDLDEILIYNLVESGGVVSDFEVYSASSGENASGFETMLLSNSAADDEYYVLVLYYEGSQSVDFFVAIRNTSFSADAEGTFSSTDEGAGLVIGPIVKSGNSYSRMASQDLEVLKVSESKLKEVKQFSVKE